MSVDIEQNVIGLMMAEPECAIKGVTGLDPSDFVDPLCLDLFLTMKKLRDGGNPIDLVSVCDAMPDKERAASVVTIFTGRDILPSSFGYYADRLKEIHRNRVLMEGLKQIIQDTDAGNAEAVDRTEKLIRDVRAIGSIGDGKVTDSDVMAALIEMGDPAAHISSGFPLLDSTLGGGFCPQDLVVIAGRPSMGKSSFAGNIACNMCRDGKTVVFFSLETPKNKLIQRISLSLVKESRYAALHDPWISHQMMDTSAVINKWNLHIFDRKNPTVSDIASMCYRVGNQKKIDAIFIDYLGYIKPAARSGKNVTRQQEVGEITRSLKALAKEFNAVVFLVCQLNRSADSRDDGRPRKSDLRESGDIEQDSDVILFPFRPSYYAIERGEQITSEEMQEAYLTIAKHRDGMFGDIPVIWHGEYFLFEPKGEQTND